MADKNKQVIVQTVIKIYYALTKPGIIYGNALAAAGGFLLAAKGHISPGLFGAMLLGLACTIGSACVFNNYIDRDIDKKMARTKKRGLATGDVPYRNALVFASALLVTGSLLLGLFTNAVALLVALFGFFAYVVVYGYAKRATVHGTVVGSISGATPPVIGYTAVTGRLDTGAALLFLVLVCWQMPHFYAIAMNRKGDYAAAGIPVLPVAKGMMSTKIHIIAYVAFFIASNFMLTAFGYTGYTFLTAMTVLGLYWLAVGVKGFAVPDEKKWARQMFGFSLIVLLGFCLMLSLEAWLP